MDQENREARERAAAELARRGANLAGTEFGTELEAEGADRAEAGAARGLRARGTAGAGGAGGAAANAFGFGGERES